MRIHGVLLGAVEEQIAGGSRVLNPAAIRETDGIPVEVNFDVERPIGWARVFHDDDGRLLFEAEVAEAGGLPPLAAYGGTDRECIAISLVERNENRNQPPWAVTPE